MSIMSPLTDRALSGGGAYSGRMTKQSLTVQRSCRLEGGSAPESVAIREVIKSNTGKNWVTLSTWGKKTQQNVHGCDSNPYHMQEIAKRALCAVNSMVLR